MALKFWDEESAEVTITKNGRGEEIRVKKVAKRGKEYVDVRTFYPDQTTGEMQPGKGIAVPIENLDAVLEAIDLVRECDLYA